MQEVLHWTLALVFLVAYAWHVFLPRAPLAVHAKRAVFISYVALLYSAAYAANPTVEWFVNAVVMHTVALVGYAVLFVDAPDYHQTLWQKSLFFALLVLAAPFVSPRMTGWPTALTVGALVAYAVWRRDLYGR